MKMKRTSANKYGERAMCVTLSQIFPPIGFSAACGLRMLAKFRRKKPDTLRREFEHRSGHQAENAGTETIDEERRHERTENCAQRTADGDEPEKTFTLFGRKQVGHERPRKASSRKD